MNADRPLPAHPAELDTWARALPFQDRVSSSLSNPGSGFARPFSPSRRRSPRLPVDGRGIIRMVTSDVAEVQAEIRDISLGGIGLAASFPLVPGDVHGFRVITKGGRLCALTARVVHCLPPSGEETSYLIGCEFQDDSVTEQGLNRIIQSLTEEAE